MNHARKVGASLQLGLPPGHLNTQRGGTEDRTSNLLVTSQPALPPELSRYLAFHPEPCTWSILPFGSTDFRPKRPKRKYITHPTLKNCWGAYERSLGDTGMKGTRMRWLSTTRPRWTDWSTSPHRGSKHHLGTCGRTLRSLGKWSGKQAWSWLDEERWLCVCHTFCLVWIFSPKCVCVRACVRACTSACACVCVRACFHMWVCDVMCNIHVYVCMCVFV